MAPTSPTTSSNIEIFSSSRCRICSSRVPRVTRLNTNTSRCWPMRSMRPMRCSIAIGFHGTSKLISVLQNWMLRPSPPDSVHSSTGTRSRNSAMAASLSGPLRPPSKRAKAMPSRASRRGQVIERLAVMDEDQLLLVRIAPQQVEQRRLLAAGAEGGPSLRQRLPACIDVAAGEAPHGAGGRGRRRSGGAEQVLQREPVCPIGRQPARRGGKLVVGVRSPSAPSTRMVAA